MSSDVICLRPEHDFLKVGVTPSQSLSIRYLSPDDSDLAVHMTEARVLVIPAVGPKLPAELFADSTVELVQVTGAGVDRIDADAMKALGICVANVPGGSGAAVAEYAVSSALVLLRQTCWADAELRKGNYVETRKSMVAANPAGLEGLTVGVVGFGIIGMAVAKAFHCMGSRIVYHDPVVRDPDLATRLGARALPLKELLGCSEIVTLHVPLLPSTRSMIGERELERMQAGAVLINAARGGIVDEAALAAQLLSGRLGGAAVDVYSTEPPLADNPLFSIGNEAGGRLLLTPHIAGVTRQSWEFLFRSAWQNVERVLIQDEPPANRVF
ncbi:MAG: NAD(P)-dependent oxidoreductase [Woeseia sp.]